MSRTLNFHAFLLNKARTLHNVGLNAHAEEILARLATVGDLPAEAAEEVHSRLGDINLDKEDYRQARRHLTAAVARVPGNARHHQRLAIALQDDPRGDERKAGACFRRAVKRAPDDPHILADYALFLLDQGRRAESFDLLQQACDHAGDDANLLGRIVDGLLAQDEHDQAEQLLRCSLFRHSRSRALRALWDDFRFRKLAIEQESCEASVESAPEEPAILPFLRCIPKPTRTRTAPKVRQDKAAARGKPHTARRATLSL